MTFTTKGLQILDDIILRHQIRKIESMILNLEEETRVVNNLLDVTRPEDSHYWMGDEASHLDTHCTGIYDPGLTFDDLWYW